MRTPPRRVKVAPFTYTVHVVPSLPDGGNMDTENLTILIQKEQAELAKRDSLLHEVLHTTITQGISHRLKELDEHLEEALVATMAPRILGVLRDNPGLVAYLTERGI